MLRYKEMTIVSELKGNQKELLICKKKLLIPKEFLLITYYKLLFADSASTSFTVSHC
ncbi:MAG TPA: hypothetical protein PLS84_07445 [Salinivirgaceae bacterium]|nr:hypothetical protein [Salinivirgaceae bacterium]